MTTVTLSLISHTNVGKTALARTLLRRDIGEVRDQPHVTTVAEAHVLIETDDARLVLWDTPGFGDTARLMARLRRERDPLGWFLHQVWDRVANRPLWCSQEAVRNIRDEADVVLYLVNATEDPAEAGYLPLELELLAWMDRIGLERPHLFGNSFGCQVIADLAARHPDRVGRLVLQGPTMDPRARSAWRQVPRWLVVAPFERYSEGLILLRDIRDLGPRRAVTMIRMALRDPIEQKLGRIVAPTLVVRGTRDAIVPN